MAYTTVPTKSPGDTIASADWNTYVRDNLAFLHDSFIAGLIGHYNGSSAPAGWSEFTAARGLFICGLLSGGTLATAVGTPLTNQQNISHTHQLNGNAVAGGGSNGNPLNGSPAGGQGNIADVNAWTTVGSSAGSIGMPYLQLLTILKA